jgi:DNA (cytosine-5)-methyltransferase 1
MNARLVDVIENDPPDAPFHAPEQTRRLIDLMTAPHREKLREAMASGAKKVGALYRRTRVVDGVKRQCAEVRFDGVAGCLRTPGGGSSRQFIVIVEGERVRTRLISGREAARLMGLAEDYILPKRYSETLHLLGDGVSVPVVRFLAEHLFAPLVEARALAAAE